MKAAITRNRDASQVRRWPAGLVAGACLSLLLVAAFLAPEHLPDLQPALRYAPPSALPPFGADDGGRPLLAYAQQGARVAVLPAVAAGLLVGLLATLGGLIRAMGFHRLDRTVQAVGEVVVALPRMVVVLVVALVIARIPVESITRWPWLIYGVTVASLIAVRVIGVSALGAQSLINIAGFNVQPSEFAKVGAILLLARMLARHPVERPVDLLRPVALISFPWLLVLLQPDLGTSLVFGAVLLVMMFWSGMPGSWVVLFLSPVITAIVAGVFPWLLLGWIPAMGLLAWKSLPWNRIGLALVLMVQGAFAVATPWLWNNFLQPHQRDRLTLFLDPNKDPLGGGYPAAKHGGHRLWWLVRHRAPAGASNPAALYPRAAHRFHLQCPGGGDGFSGFSPSRDWLCVLDLAPAADRRQGSQ